MNKTKICIIKLGALGDVVRTTPILEAIKEKYPHSEITWITKPSSKEILEDNNLIDKLLLLPHIPTDKFDILYSLDIDEQATKIANKIIADEKYGFYDNEGFPASFNEEAEYYLNTVFDDYLKKSNRKTYQEMIFDMCKLHWKKQPISIKISEQARQNISDFIEENNIQGKILGFNIGSSPRWPSKAWHKSRIIEFIKDIHKDYTVILLGGPEEIESMEEVEKELDNIGIKVYAKNTSNSLKDFFALIDICDVIVCADTLALHLALGLNKPTIALFLCTPAWEIEDYDLAKKITSPIFDNFFPERMDQYDEELVKSISVNQVLKALSDLE
ncbi:MAG: glycosyltransferase family 9 protein [Nanoarchaeota archaeon]